MGSAMATERIRRSTLETQQRADFVDQMFTYCGGMGLSAASDARAVVQGGAAGKKGEPGSRSSWARWRCLKDEAPNLRKDLVAHSGRAVECQVKGKPEHQDSVDLRDGK